MDKFRILRLLFISLFLVALIASNVFFYLKSMKQNDQLLENSALIGEYEKQLQNDAASMEAIQKELQEAKERSEAIPASASMPKDTLAYQSLYPDMVAEFSGFAKSKNSKTAYLTFDDGPSSNTDRILDILDAYQIKATFFVACKENDENKKRLKSIAERGHTIGIHTYSHVYKSIYTSVEDYLEDFYKEYSLVYEATGIKASIFRFPGGSINSYNAALYQQLIAEMLRRNFIYYDWNVSSGDATASVSAAAIVGDTISQARRKTKAIILFHDAPSKSYTVEALPSIIEKLKAEGYAFEALDNSVAPINFGYKN